MKKKSDYSRLIIIGNGFDLMHNLPTDFSKNFKPIAQRFEQGSGFQDHYGHGDDLWSSFEIALGSPDFNELFEIFDTYYPDYTSDHESDRDSIITQVDLVGHLEESLNEFASIAETKLKETLPLNNVKIFFDLKDYFVSFNYTSTIETLYNIKPSRVLYPHGKTGNSKLITGYEDGNFYPEPIYEVIKDRLPARVHNNVKEYIESIEDYYISTAYKNLYEKVHNFKKIPKVHDLLMFIDKIRINEVVIIGHSCRIDFKYFETINIQFQDVLWNFFYYNDEDKENIRLLCKRLGLNEGKVNINKNQFN